MDRSEWARFIIDECRKLGFHRAGIIPVEPAARHAIYDAWVADGYAGEMTWLASPEAQAQRRDVREIFPAARTLVVVGLSYGGPTPTGVIARYARGEDYHMTLKRKLTALTERIGAAAGQPVAARSCVDSAHVLERDLGERAGLGFVGKNTLLIAPGVGSYLLLGELLLDLDVAATAEEPARKRCGSCRLCLDACPTGAFVGEHILDARRCISYLTIELRGSIPRDLRPLMGTMIFGCDICQEVCPFNAGQGVPGAPELAPGRHAAPDLIALLGLGAAQFRQFVKRTALRRIPRAQLWRNVCVALGNAGDAGALPALRHALDGSSPLVRGHAAWALGRLGDREALEARRLVEVDADVQEEIDLALALR